MDSDTRKLLLQLSNGMSPEDLDADDISLLKAYFGDEWFWRLGYSEKVYKHPEDNLIKQCR